MKESEREEFLASKIICVVYHACIFERELVFVSCVFSTYFCAKVFA